MISNKVWILALSMLIAVSFITARHKPNAPFCKTKQSCLNNPKCECYCGVECGPRQKKADDAPIWIENDPYGHNCYCKQRDLDLVRTGKCGPMIEEKEEAAEIIIMRQ
jgi:hypothetical protein